MFLSTYTALNSWFYLLFTKSVNSYNDIFSMFNVYMNFGSDNCLNFPLNLNKNISLYAGHHKDMGVTFANIICPTVTAFEKSAKYLNFFQDIKMTDKLITSPVLAKLEIDLLDTLNLFFFNKSENLDEFKYVKFKYFMLNVNYKLCFLNTLFKTKINNYLIQNVYLKNSKIFNYIKRY